MFGKQFRANHLVNSICPVKPLLKQLLQVVALPVHKVLRPRDPSVDPVDNLGLLMNVCFIIDYWWLIIVGNMLIFFKNQDYCWYVILDCCLIHVLFVFGITCLFQLSFSAQRSLQHRREIASGTASTYSGHRRVRSLIGSHRYCLVFGHPLTYTIW